MSVPNPEVVDEPHIAWEESVWFSDVDDTLIDTAGVSATASDGICQVFESAYGLEKATQVQANFNALFALMMAGYRARTEEDWQQILGGREAFEDLVVYFESVQQQVAASFGHFKKWSREVFIKRAAEQANVEVSPELVHEAADAYWTTLTERTEVFPDALALSNDIAAHKRPLFLVTSSDARLRMQPDGQFVYDPVYSEGLKRQRIELLREKGLQFRAISIGDPEDKPHPNFFNKALKVAEEALGAPVNTAQAIMLGDSYGGDLQTPKEQLGFGLVVLRDKAKDAISIDDGRQITVNDLCRTEDCLV